MGKRKAIALTEAQVVGIRDVILNKASDKMRDKLFFFYEIMVKTGVRRSDGSYLAEAGHQHKTQELIARVQKQSKVKPGEKPVYVDRLYKLPDNVFYALQTGQYDFPVRSVEGVKHKVTQIRELLRGTQGDRPLMPHDLRKTFILMLKHRGGDIFDVKSVTKHASLDSLIKYYDEDDEIILAAYESLEKDYFDLSQPAKLMREINKLRIENKTLRALNAQKEGKYE